MYIRKTCNQKICILFLCLCIDSYREYSSMHTHKKQKQFRYLMHWNKLFTISSHIHKFRKVINTFDMIWWKVIVFFYFFNFYKFCFERFFFVFYFFWLFTRYWVIVWTHRSLQCMTIIQRCLSITFCNICINYTQFIIL